MWTLILLLSLNLSHAEATPAAKESFQPIEESVESRPELPGTTVNGTVRVIRGSPETEVFFKDLKDSLIIPKDSSHNKIYEACEESRKKRTPVSLRIDAKNRRILGLAAAPVSRNEQTEKSKSSNTSTENSSK